MSRLTSDQLDYLEKFAKANFSSTHTFAKTVCAAVAELRDIQAAEAFADGQPCHCKACNGVGERGKGQDWYWYCFACMGTGLAKG